MFGGSNGNYDQPLLRYQGPKRGTTLYDLWFRRTLKGSMVRFEILSEKERLIDIPGFGTGLVAQHRSSVRHICKTICTVYKEGVQSDTKYWILVGVRLSLGVG